MIYFDTPVDKRFTLKIDDNKFCLYQIIETKYYIKCDINRFWNTVQSLIMEKGQIKSI